MKANNGSGIQVDDTNELINRLIEGENNGIYKN